MTAATSAAASVQTHLKLCHSVINLDDPMLDRTIA